MDAPGGGHSAATLSIAARLNRLPVTRTHKRIIAVVALGLFFENYELFLTGTLSTTLKRSFGIHGAQLSAVLASAFVGAFIGAVVIGRLADRIGRRNAYFLTLSLYSIFSLVGAFSPNAWVLIISRFVAGIGLGGELPITDSYLGDLLPAHRRGFYTAWAFTLAYIAVPVVSILGFGLVQVAPFGMAGWRWMFGIGALGAAVAFFLRRALPESPRWLESVGRAAEAQAIVQRFEEAAGVEHRALPVPADSGPVATAPLPASALLRRPLVRRTALMTTVWITTVVGYYGFGHLATLALGARGYSAVASLGYSAISFVGYPIGSALSMVIMERLERKWILAVSCLAMSVFGIAYGYSTATAAIVVFGFCFTLASNVMANSCHIYQAEQFPTSIRATANGWLYSLSRLSTAAAPFYLIPLLTNHGPAAAFAVVGVAMITAVLALAAFGVRTTGLGLETIGRDDALASASVPVDHGASTGAMRAP